MKKYYFSILLLTISISIFSQQPYYDDLDLNLTGLALKSELATKITVTHTNKLSYGWNATQATDLNPSNTSNVFLIYGWEDGSDSDCTNDLERNVNSNSGDNCDWNREHTYANSLGTPKLETGGKNMTSYSDSHNLRASDVQRNGQRANRLFATGSGNSSTVGSYWYPGDEWKGDVARIVMYMYLRYGSQCLPNNVIIGSSNSVDVDMIDLLLDWNAEDPVSQYEDNRNIFHQESGDTFAQGNRNPFIDEPYLATIIWGGTPAEDRWGLLSVADFSLDDVEIYPNPSFGNNLSIKTSVDLDIAFFDILGKEILNDKVTPRDNFINIESLNSGMYLVRLQSENGAITKKFIKR